MRSFWLDPYLWVHLAGVAVVPIALEGCLLGFAASNTLLPPWMELLLVGGIGALPILWMQWQRPFCIYSLMFLAVQPQKLSEDQRRILRRFKQPLGKGLSVLTAVLLLVLLWQIYQLAPIAWESAAIVPGGAVGGLLLAAASFLISNLFLQVPVSVAQVMLTDEGTIAATEPYPANAVARDFSLFGIRVNQILPPLSTAAVPASASASAAGTATPGSAAPSSAASRSGGGDRVSRKAKPRFADPMPGVEPAANLAPNPAASPAPNSAAPTPASKPKRNIVPVEVIDAEFRELGADAEWDEVIVSEEESLTTAPAEAAAPAKPIKTSETGISETSETADAAETAETHAEATLDVEPGTADAERYSPEPGAAEPTTDSPTDTPIDTSINTSINTSPDLQADAPTEAGSNPEIYIDPQPIAETPEPAPAVTLPPEDDLIEPIPDPIEEQLPLEKVSASGEDMLQISSITLIETEDVSEGVAVDLAAVEVVTAEIVEDVSEDAAVPAETIESWLEDDWEEAETD